MAETGDYNNTSIINFSLKDGERFYGGGSTSRDHIQHRGELLRMWTTYQHTEIPMPVMISSENWGVFNNTTRKNFFDIGHYQSDIFSIYNTTDEADFYLMFGNSMPNIINHFTLITGRPYVLPKWAYGLCFGPNMLEDQFHILNDAVRFREIGVPCDLFWLEPQWMEKRYDFSTKKKWNYKQFSAEPYWDSVRYPKREHHRLLVGRLHEMGYHMGLWLCAEYDLSLPEEDKLAAAAGKPTSGQEHWMDHLKHFLDNGVDGFKVDPARTIDEHPTREYYNGRTDKEMHNLNQVLLPKQMNLMTRGHLGRRTWHHYTAGWAGTQHWGASTSGDNGGGRTALFDQLNLGVSGFMNTSCDVMSVVKEQEVSAKAEQKEMNDLQIVMDVVSKGADYWNKLMTIGMQKSLVSYQEQTAIKQVIMMAQTGNVPVSSSGKVPFKTMTTIKLVLAVKDKLEAEGISI
jgi:alpha-glucosidase (family GH31 glycosyl hydrolase)